MLRKIIVALSICVWVMSGSARAQCPEGSSLSGDYCYTHSGGNVTISKYVGAGGAVVIPGTIEAMPVVHIGNDAFRNDTSLTSVTIPAGLTSIGDSAFNGCASLTSVSIPASVTSIGEYVFWACTSLTSIEVAPANENYSSDGGVLYNKTQTRLIKYPAAKPGAAFGIPGTVTSIAHGAFHRNTVLTSVNIPNSVTNIDNHAFDGCSSLASVNIPSGVTSIAGYLFSGCTSLASVNIPDSVTSIGFASFRYCSSLASVNIPNGVTSIAGYTFQDCTSLASVNIPDSVTSIGFCAFDGCSGLTSVHIPNGVTLIDSYAFRNTSLTSITIPNSVITINYHAFLACTVLTSVVIGNSVTSIGRAAFEGCSSLTTAYFLGNAPTLGSGVFSNYAPGFNICYTPRATGFTSPVWEGYPAADCACASDRDCDMDELCGENVCEQTPGTIEITRATVKAGKARGADSMQFSGWMDATEADLNTAKGGDIIISIDAEDIPDLNETTYAFPVTDATIAKGRYRSPKVKPANKADPLLAFSFDSVKGTMRFSGKNLDLTGLSCPFTVLVQFGDYAAGIQVVADRVNRGKACPLPLLMGVKDTLSADKVKAKKGKTIGTDSISVSGTFTAAGGFNQALPVIITLGPDTFTIPGNEFILSNGRYLCKKVDSGNGIIMARFDIVKCTYSISIKGADISGSGNVAFGIDIFGNDLPPDQIALPAGF